MMRHPPRIRGLLAWTVWLTLLPPAAGAAVEAASGDAGIAIEVDENQLVTLDTQATSLAALVRALCAKAGVQIRGFETPDRPIAATYDGVPLRDVLQRLLRDDTYMLGVRAGADPRDVEVAWIHVTASKIVGGSAPPVPTAPPGPTSPTTLPSALSTIGAPAEVIVDAIGSADATKRHDATLALADYVDENPGVLDTFLSGEISASVDELTPYLYAHEALNTLALRQQNPVNRARLDGIAKSLKLKNGGPSKKPTFAELMGRGISR